MLFFKITSKKYVICRINVKIKLSIYIPLKKDKNRTEKSVMPCLTMSYSVFYSVPNKTVKKMDK